MNTKTIQIKNRYTNKVIFTHSVEGNTIKLTVEEAVKRKVDLSNADLSNADLSNADLRYADLRYAYLYNAYLYNADLYNADLYKANLSNADLYNADLYNANLYNANLSNVKNLNESSLWFNQTRILPEGDIIGYKKCRDNIVVKLLIPKEAKRSHAFGRKCRAEYAKVLEIFDENKIAYSKHDETFIYEVGKTVKPVEPFSEDWKSECESGIHFFITKIEVEHY